MGGWCGWAVVIATGACKQHCAALWVVAHDRCGEQMGARDARVRRGLQGGQSASVIEAAPDVGPTVARWKGDLILEVR